MDFEWDDNKAAANYKKHGVRFAEAVTIWLDSNALEKSDEEHSDEEDRWIRLGFSSKLNLLVVVHVEKIEGELIRIISARKAEESEELEYIKRVRR